MPKIWKIFWVLRSQENIIGGFFQEIDQESFFFQKD